MSEPRKSELGKIINNTLISLLGQLVTWSSTLGLTIAYGRFLGDVRFGELYFATMFVGLIGFPVEYGFNQQLTRDVAQDPDKAHAYLWNTLFIKTTLWIVLYGGILLTARGLGYSQEQWILVAICGVNLMAGSVVSTFAALHYAFSRTVFPSVGMMIEKSLDAIVGFVLLKNGASVEIMAFVLLGGTLADALWVGTWFFRLVGWRLVFERATIVKLFRSSIPFIAYGILGVIYYRIDTVLLSLMTSTAVVGWYGAAYRLFDTLLFVPNLIINAVMYPVFAKLSKDAQSESSLKLAIEKSLNLLLLCALPIAALMIFAAPNIVGFLYHRDEFDNSIPALQFLAPGLVFLYINTLLSSIIVSMQGEKKIPIMAALALIFNLGMNLLLIPLYKHVGAALVTSLTELLLMCISLLFIPNRLLPAKSIGVACKALISAMMMAASIYLMRTWSILLITPLSFLIYTGSAFVLRTIPREDMQSLLQAVKNKGKKKGLAVEVLANIADENIYESVTNPYLPAVYGQVTDHHLSIANARTKQLEALIAEEDDATLLLPAIGFRKRQSEMLVDDDDPTLLLPAVKLKGTVIVQNRDSQPEVVGES